MLMEEILAAVRGKPELGEHREQGFLARRFAHELERGHEVVLRIGDAHHRRGNRDPREAVAIQVEEVLHALILRGLVYGTLSHMLLLRETVVTRDGTLEIELHDDLRYRLSWQGVVYDQKRRYDFRSVEQLRYDFERDVEKA